MSVRTRIVVRVAAWLLVGLVLHVGVALALFLRPHPVAWFARWPEPGRYREAPAAYDTWIVRRPGFLQVSQTHHMVGITASSIITRRQWMAGVPRCSAFRDATPLAEAEVEFAGAPTGLRSFTESWAGWPLLSLRATEFRVRAVGGVAFRSRRGAMDLPPAIADRTERDLIPVRPAFIGFVGNTVAYAVAAAALPVLFWSGPRALRTSRRRRRGLCVHCAYPAGPTPVCPECGRP